MLRGGDRAERLRLAGIRLRRGIRIEGLVAPLARRLRRLVGGDGVVRGAIRRRGDLAALGATAARGEPVVDVGLEFLQLLDQLAVGVLQFLDLAGHLADAALELADAHAEPGRIGRPATVAGRAAAGIGRVGTTAVLAVGRRVAPIILRGGRQGRERQREQRGDEEAGRQHRGHPDQRTRPHQAPKSGRILAGAMTALTSPSAPACAARWRRCRASGAHTPAPAGSGRGSRRHRETTGRRWSRGPSRGGA